MKRYSRNIACIGSESQKRLSESSVFIIGCGALGGQISMLLAGAGLGRIAIADFDTIDISNLQRQLFFKESDIGKKKVDTLAASMRGLNSDISIIALDKKIRERDAETLLSEYDYIIDATDNPSTKYMTDRICRRISKPGNIGGVSGWRGQIMTIPGSPDPGYIGFSDIFPAPEENTFMLPCEIDGVIGAAAATVASIQASEALAYLIGERPKNASRLITVDLLKGQFHTFTAEA